jgi:hypothetical protein
MSTLRISLVAAMVGAALLPAAAIAQPSWRHLVPRQLGASALREDLRSRGFAETHNPFIDVMGARAQKTVPVDLEAGRSYRFIGVCDTDCSDLDFRLYDEGGTLVDSDVEDDDVPIVDVTPARAGTYRLGVTMASCSTSSCGWGVAVYGSGSRAAATTAAGGDARITPIGGPTAASTAPAPTSSGASPSGGSASGASASGTAWIDHVRAALESSSLRSSARSEGFAEMGSPTFKLAAAGGTQGVEVELQAGRSYKFIAKCDRDCGDLDLRLFDPQGATVASDTSSDAIPLLSFDAPRTGRHLLQVSMVRCSTSTCGWGLVMLAK